MTFEFGDVLKSTIKEIGDVRVVFLCPSTDRSWDDMEIIVLRTSSFIGWSTVKYGDQMGLYSDHWVKDESWPAS